MKTLIAAFLLALPVMGAETNTITARDGKTYSGAVITRVDAGGITIDYAPAPGANGMARLKFENLPEPMQKQFNYNPTNAAAFEKQRAEGAAQYGRKLMQGEEEARFQKLIDLDFQRQLWALEEDLKQRRKEEDQRAKEKQAEFEQRERAIEATRWSGGTYLNINNNAVQVQQNQNAR